LVRPFWQTRYLLAAVHIPKVLLVNDDAASLFALEALLRAAPRQHQYAPITAGTGSEALRQVKQGVTSTDELSVLSSLGRDQYRANFAAPRSRPRRR
jgi:hypothetical protein